MSTKFVSKNSNYMVVVKPGMEGNRVLGTHSIPGLYVKFQAGVVDVKDESIIAELRKHPAFGIEFLEIKPEEIDPFLDVRNEIEPEHVISEIKYGHAEKVPGQAKPAKLSPQLKKIIETEAVKMIPGILKSNPAMLKEIIMGMAAEMKAKEPEAISATEVLQETEPPKKKSAK